MSSIREVDNTNGVHASSFSLSYVLCIDITLVLTPGYLEQRNYSHQLLCMWNITCPEDHVLYVNSTDLVLQGKKRHYAFLSQ